ncbi:acetate--CoA ligase family protein [Pseudonocardia hispaniensis]|uniref:Acetate--CoA ligase family protein n=1 Tax=Pseudonocardia hispaniensis TaxID=904933 RepID=A0ABW1J0T6_9PSEU
MSEAESKQRLGDWLPACRERLTRSPAEAADFMAGGNGVFVAKASGVAHKTEGNLVRVGLPAEYVLAQWEELAAAGDGSVLVADFVRPEYELLIGATRDEQFGPVLTVGQGGVMTESIDDVVCFLHPLDRDDFGRGLEELRCARLLHGQRGRPGADLERLYELGSHLLDVLVADPDVMGVDLNPVAIIDGRPVVLDALVILSGA